MEANVTKKVMADKGTIVAVKRKEKRKRTVVDNGRCSYSENKKRSTSCHFSWYLVECKIKGKKR